MRVKTAKSPIHGMGVFAHADIEVDEWDNVYGMLIPSPSTYGFEHDGVWWEPFPPFRYLNHSDSPNCEVSMDDDEVMEIIALRDIEKGEELTIDYGFDPEEDYDDPNTPSE